MGQGTVPCVLFTLCVLSVLITPIICQIHRAKVIQSKLGSGGPGIARYPPGPFNDYDNEAKFKQGTLEDGELEQPPKVGHSRETWVFSIVSAMLVGLSGIFPLAVIPLEVGKALRHGAPAARLKLLLSFVVGGLLGDVFLHLLPEAWAHLDKGGHDHEGHMTVGLWVIAGLFTFLIIEKIFPDGHDDDAEEENDEIDEPVQTSIKASSNGHVPRESKISNPPALNTRQRKSQKPYQNGTNHLKNGYMQNGATKNGIIKQNGHVPNENGHAPEKEDTKEAVKESDAHIKTSGWLNLLANVIDNFTHGLAVAGSYCISTKTGLITTVAVLLHEIPHEIGDFAILLQSGFDRWKAAKAQLLTASGGMLGAIAALSAESAQAAGDRTAWILPFTSGGFIYIALVTVVPDLLKETNNWNSVKQVVLMLTGTLLVAGVTLLCD